MSSRTRSKNDSNRRSISLKETESDDEGYGEDVDDQFEAFGPEGGKRALDKSAWNEGGARRGEILRKLVKCFSLLVTEKGSGKRSRKNRKRRRQLGADAADEDNEDEDSEDGDDDDDDDDDDEEADDGEDDDSVETMYDHSGRVINKKYQKGLKAQTYILHLRG